MPGMMDLGEFIQRGNPEGYSVTGDGNVNGEPRRIDPASVVPGASPNLGQFIAPHVLTFSGVVSSMSRTYRPSDEAVKDSYENARYMRNDLVVMECVEARQRACALLNWHI